MIDFIKTVALTTLLQLISFLGIITFFALVLFLLRKLITNIYFNAFGWKGVLFTAWIGTPIHEASHALMCVLFGHKIVTIRFFKPEKKTGMLGYLSHSWDSRSLYQSIGNFFIGAAPIVFGIVCIIFILYTFQPQLYESIFTSFKRISFGKNGILASDIIFVLPEAALDFMKVIFSRNNFSDWKYYVFLYLSLSVAAHIAPSPSDFRGMQSGFIIILIFLMMGNSLAYIFSINTVITFRQITSYTVMMGAMYLYATVITVGNFIISWLVLNSYTLLRFQRWLNPFQRPTIY